MKIEQIEISKLKLDKNQPRKTFDEEKLNDMAETFKTQGTIQPIEIDENNVIVTGELRFRSAKKAGLKEIPCKIIKGLTPESRLERQLVENFNRQDMKLVDSIEAVKRFMKSLSSTLQRNSSTDEKIGEVAKRLGVNRGWLSQNLKLEREAPKELKQAVKDGKVSVSTAVEIMKAPEEERKELTQEILEEADVPEHRKIRERIQEKKELKELKDRNEVLKKSKEYEIRISTTAEHLSELRRQIDEEAHRLGKIYSMVKGIKRTKLYVAKAKDKENFFRFLDGVIDKVKKWGDELSRLKDDIELEVIRE